MQSGRSLWRAAVCVMQLFLCSFLASAAGAQDDRVPLLVLDQDRFFIESSFGKAAVARERAATEALDQENNRIEAKLVAEEQELTSLRATLSAEEFTTRASAFDEKVERIRTEQDAKVRVLAGAREKDRQEFLQVAGPVLGELLSEKRALAIIDKKMIILSLSAIDVTDEAIAKLDQALADPAPPQP
jgi:Skp family chaperone for outer membrane proteins